MGQKAAAPGGIGRLMVWKKSKVTPGSCPSIISAASCTMTFFTSSG